MQYHHIAKRKNLPDLGTTIPQPQSTCL
jgi:hypothetical protein